MICPLATGGGTLDSMCPMLLSKLSSQSPALQHSTSIPLPGIVSVYPTSTLTYTTRWDILSSLWRMNPAPTVSRDGSATAQFHLELLDPGL